VWGKYMQGFSSSHQQPAIVCYCQTQELEGNINTNYYYCITRDSSLAAGLSARTNRPLPSFPSSPPTRDPVTTSTSNNTNTNTNTTMVATRRSLGANTPGPSSSPPTAPPTQPTRAQQAALKKLEIAGTPVLKGEARAAEAAKDDKVQTYHFRGAVYAADENTPSEWLENQPKRYLKRARGDSAGAESRGEGSIVVAGEEEGDGDEEEQDENDDDDEDDTPARPAKRRRTTLPAARGKPRAGRGGSRASLPTTKKAARPRDNNITNNSTPTMTATPTTKSPLPNQKAMEETIRRRKQEAKKKNYNVEPLNNDDILVAARSRVVKLAIKQKLLRALLLEWNLAKELLESKKKEAGAKLLEQVDTEIQDAPEPEETNYQPTMEIGQSDSDDDDEPHANSDEIHQQWQREQEQNRMNQQAPEIPETSPAAQELQVSATPPAAIRQLDSPGTSPATQQPKERLPANSQPKTIHSPTSDLAFTTIESLLEAPATTAGASRPQTPTPAPTPEQTLPQPPLPAHANTTPSTVNSSRTNNRARASNSTSKEPSTTPFSHLPVDSILPTTASDGSAVRWTLKRRTSFIDPDFEITLTRDPGESKSARRRRILREKELADSWAAETGGIVWQNGK
jgi:hypothetical protein